MRYLERTESAPVLVTEQVKGEDENNNEKIPNVKDLRPSEEDEEIVASN